MGAPPSPVIPSNIKTFVAEVGEFVGDVGEDVGAVGDLVGEFVGDVGDLVVGDPVGGVLVTSHEQSISTELAQLVAAPVIQNEFVAVIDPTLPVAGEGEDDVQPEHEAVGDAGIVPAESLPVQ